MTSIRVAAVQAAPVFLDLSASVDKAIALITEAASSGAALIGFPEGYLPGHPGWVEFLPFEGQSLLLGKRLFQESLEIPSSNIDRLTEVARAHSISIVMGCCERIAGSTGSLYNTQFFISADGEYRGKHQKIVPTVGERLFHAPGNTGSSCAFPTPFGQVSALICGENSNPLSQYAAIREYPVVHVAAWPQHFSATVPMQPVIRLVSAALAYSMKSFVINAVSTVSAEMVSAYGSLPGGEFLNSPLARGRASVISPTGQVLAEAPDDSEQLVYADIDTDTVIIPKIVHDYAGHYNRPDLFAHLF